MNALQLAKTLNRLAVKPQERETREAYLKRLQTITLSGVDVDDFQDIWFRKFAHCGEELEITGLAFMKPDEIEQFQFWFALPEVLDDLDVLVASVEVREALKRYSQLVRVALPDRVEAFKARCRELGFLQGDNRATA